MGVLGLLQAATDRGIERVLWGHCLTLQHDHHASIRMELPLSPSFHFSATIDPTAVSRSAMTPS
jgi:hypothetical protein